MATTISSWSSFDSPGRLEDGGAQRLKHQFIHVDSREGRYGAHTDSYHDRANSSPSPRLMSPIANRRQQRQHDTCACHDRAHPQDKQRRRKFSDPLRAERPDHVDRVKEAEERYNEARNNHQPMRARAWFDSLQLDFRW